MIVRLRLRPIASPRQRAARLPWIVLSGLAFLLLSLWDPVTTPGPILCLSRLAFAIPCPLCGATRGVALCLRGRLADASVFNPLAVPLAILGAVLLVRWSYEYVTNQEIALVWGRPWRIAGVVLTCVAVVAAWAYLLTWRREDDFAGSWLGVIVHTFW